MLKDAVCFLGKCWLLLFVMIGGGLVSTRHD